LTGGGAAPSDERARDSGSDARRPGRPRPDSSGGDADVGERGSVDERQELQPLPHCGGDHAS